MKILRLRYALSLLAGLALLGLPSACKGPDTDPEPAPKTFEEVILEGGYPAPPALPFYQETNSSSQDTTFLDANGVPETWNCTSKDVELSVNNQDFPLFTAGTEVIFPGNLLQGNSLQQATPSIIPLSRGPGTITISSLNGSDSTGITQPVDEVSFESIAVATNQIIGANVGNLSANTTLEISEINSTEEIGVAMGLSYKDLKTNIKGSFEYNNSQSYSRYLVKLTQSFYTLVFSVPTVDQIDQTFGPDVTPEQLATYVYEGNPATYISSVNYGRVFYLLIQSTQSSTEVKAAIDLSFNAVVSKGEADIDVSYINDLEEKVVKGYAYGGDANLAGGALMGDLNQVANFIKEGAAINNGAPLSYVVRSLADPSQVVSTSLATQYTITNCVPLGKGKLKYLNRQDLSTALGLPYQVVSGDINGDQLTDLVLYHGQQSANEVQIAFAQGDGSYQLGPLFTHPQTPSIGWTTFDLYTTDLDGDGADDLIWNSVSTGKNYLYTGLSNGDGTFTPAAGITYPSSSWGNYQLFTGNFNGDAQMDIAWNVRNSSHNRTYFAMTQSDGTPAGSLKQTQFIGAGWAPYRAFTGNFNGDAYDDFVFRRYQNGSALHLARSDGNGNLSTNGYEIGTGWDKYKWTLVGEVNKDGFDDVVMVNRAAGVINMFPANGTDGIINSRITTWFDLNTDDSGFTPYLVDFNEDGVMDFLYNDLGTSKNTVRVGLATGDGRFDFKSEIQSHPSSGEDWKQFNNKAYPGQLNADKKTDLTWVQTAQTMVIYVALAL
ncbi:MAG: thiol-activated cytolysin family protein [Bacteroidota bacterium]